MKDSPLRVLVVDDEPELAWILAQRLRADGLEAETAADGKAALRAARAWRPHVVLLDLSMPELDGWQLCRALRGEKRTEAAALVIMTAWATSDLEARAKKAGARGLLLKPFDERRIGRLVREAAWGHA